MSEKTINIWVVYIIAIVIICGFAIGGYFIGAGRSAGKIAELDRRYDNLNREYTDRQREIEEGIGKCIRIIERTEANTTGAISNLRTAIEYIKQGIEEREALKSELSHIRASLYSDRDMDRIPDSEINHKPIIQ